MATPEHRPTEGPASRGAKEARGAGASERGVDAVDGAQGRAEAAPDDEAFVMRRLGEADALVRAGLATIVEGGVEGAVEVAVDEAVAVRVPLPPAPLAPSIRYRTRAGTAAAPDGDPPLTAVHVEALRRALMSALPGSLTVEADEDALELVWQPSGVSALGEATRRSRAAAEQLALTRGAARRTGDWAAALAELDERLARHRGRAERLARAFRDHALVRLPELGVMHLLAHRADPDHPEAPRLVVLQSDPDLLSPATGRGVFAALRLAEWGPAARLARLAERLCELVAQRFELPAAPSDALEMLGDWAEPQHTLLIAIGESTERSFDDLLWQLTDLVRFTESIALWVTRGHNPFELLGAEDAGPNAVAATAAAPAEPPPPSQAPPAAEAPPAPSPEPPPPPRRPPIPEPPAAKAGPERAEPEPTAATEEAPAGPTAWGRPLPTPGRRGSDAIDRLSAREVVKKLGMQEEADVDVFMSHAGYNPQKTIDIMALALGVSKDEAERLVESAPTLVIGPVTRTRAARAKTILEGTGATIRIVPSGEAEEPPDED